MDWDLISEEYLRVADQVVNECPELVEDIAQTIVERLKNDGKVMICGNGGSAADAQHIAGELVNRFLKERKPYAGIALSTDTSTLTAISNDYGYAHIFEKQVQALGRKGDVLIAISTSGNADNVCRAVEAAKALGILTIAFTGGAGGKLLGLTDKAICLSCTASTPRIQEGHELVFHALCERIEELMEA
ncbi:MAG: SIS domain-containing protein [Verrucomicrobia bacterium]|nr:SIS domain-containing protein [Verrucomicrobiota bacterium]